jgi:hypothetical protein
MENPDCFEVHRRLPPLHSLMAHRSSNSHHRRIPMVPGCPKDSDGLDSPIPHPVSPRRHQLDVQRRDQVLFFITIPEIPTVSLKNLFRTVGGRSLEARVYRRRLFATNPTERDSIPTFKLLQVCREWSIFRRPWWDRADGRRKSE